MSVNLKSLIGKLNAPTRSTLEAAAGLCLSRTHYNIEIEHYLMKLMDASDTDAARIFRHFEVNQSRLAAELTRSLDRLKSGNARTPAISPTVLRMLTQAWTTGSIDYGAWQVRSGFTLLALVSDEELARIVREVSKELQKIEMPEILGGGKGHEVRTEGEFNRGSPRPWPTAGKCTSCTFTSIATITARQLLVRLMTKSCAGVIMLWHLASHRLK